MKNIYVRCAALALAVITIFTFSSCSKGLFDGVESSEEEMRVIGTAGEYQVHYDELYFLVMSCKDMLKNKYGEDIWTDKTAAAQYEEELSALVYDRITSNYAVLALCEEYGIENVLSNEKLVDYVDGQIEEAIYSFAVQNGIKVTLGESMSGDITYKYERGGRAKAYEIFKEALTLTYLNERVMRLTLGAEYAFGLLSNVLTVDREEVIYKEADVEDYLFSDSFICTRHIFIQQDEGEDINANRALAEEAYGKYLDGEPMDKLISSKYNEDVTMSPSVGYYFTYGEMDKAYEEAAFALDVGEVSGVVETDKGFFIIERCEKSSTYMLGNFETLAQQVTYALVNQKVEAKRVELELTLNDLGSSLSLTDIAVEGEARLEELFGKEENK